MAELSVKLLDNLVIKKIIIADEKNRLNVYRPIMNNYLIMKVNIVYSVGQSDLCDPHGLQSARLLCPWNFPGKNTGVVCHFYSNYSIINHVTPNYLFVQQMCNGHYMFRLW